MSAAEMSKSFFFLHYTNEIMTIKCKKGIEFRTTKYFIVFHF